MKRSVQEIIELLVFALIALVIGTGLLWVVGWLFGILGFVLMEVAEFIWFLLKYIIPAAVIVAAVYALIKLAQNQNRRSSEAVPAGASAVGSGPAVYSGNANRSTLGESVAAAPQPTVTASPTPDSSKNTPPRVEAVPAPDEASSDESAEEKASATRPSSGGDKAEASGENVKKTSASTGTTEQGGTEQAEPSEGFQEMVEDEQDLPDDVQDKKSSEDKGKKSK